jgi:putative NIF3 family GTP cyclohydrolase 1 type 2
MPIHLYKRREFLGDITKAGAAGMMVSPFMNAFLPGDSVTVSEVIELIISSVPGGKLTETVDTLKSGSGNNVVTGIVTTMFATVKVIEAAAKINANFIIAHEPTFYNHPDNVNWVENNEVAKEKMALLEKYQISVWRFHDYWHTVKPDGILHGILLNTGWLPYDPREERVFQIPAKPLIEIIRDLKEALKMPHLRYIGDPYANCSIIALLPGAVDGQEQLRTLIRSGADLIVVGETREWELPEYIRDARALGRKVSLIVLGHAFSEEPGMNWLVQWLQPKLPGIRISHIESGEPFTWG